MTSRSAVFILVLGVLAGCAKNNASVAISSICVPPEDAKACEFADTCDAQAIGDVALDVAAADRLWLFVQVNNQTPENDNPDTGRTNTNGAWIRESVTSFDGVSLGDVTEPIPGSSFVPASGSAVISLIPIDEPARAALLGRVPAGGSLDVVAHVRLKGAYADTSEFETGEFDIPIRLCNGCFGLPGACAEATDVLYLCPQWGQSPATAKCDAPQ